ncbi:MAG: hypothetical protein ACH0QD_04605 [Tepidibacillus sp.]
MNAKRNESTLADYFIESEIPGIKKEELKEINENKLLAIKNKPLYITVKVRVKGKPAAMVFENNGELFFEDNDELDDYILDDPTFFRSKFRTDDEAIKNAFGLNGDGWATFTGIYYIV